MTDKNILIIGAGISGLAAGKALQASGFNVKILEARDRIGGRIHTDTSLSCAIDLGAAWIHGIENNPIYVLAKNLKLSTFISDYQNVKLYDKNGTPLVEDVQGAIEELSEKFGEYGHLERYKIPYNASVQDIISPFIKDSNLDSFQTELFLTYLRETIVHEYSADFSDLSFHYFDADGLYPGDDVLFVNGMHDVVNYLARGLDVELNQQVIQVDYSDGIKVTTNDKVYTAYKCILSVPISVIKNNCIEFLPKLSPPKLEAINNLKMGNFFKIAVEFPVAFWDNDFHFIGMLDQVWSNLLNLYPVTKKPVIVAIANGEHARSMAATRVEDIISDLLTSMKKLYGDKVVAPKAYVKTNWLNDPFSQGSYSYLPPGSFMEDYATLASPVANTLYFCGGATHSIYPATVHGAYLSGFRAAHQIQATYSK